MTQCNHLYSNDIYKNMTMNINAFTLIMHVVFDQFRPNNLFIRQLFSPNLKRNKIPFMICWPDTRRC